jgi:catechol-2,3-dioxygenase
MPACRSKRQFETNPDFEEPQMPVSGLNHYNLRGSRALLDELRDFYVAAVGLKVGERPPLNNFGYWLYAGNDAVLHLSEAAAGEIHERHAQGTFNHAAFSCTDLQSAETNLQNQSIEYRRALVPRMNQIQLFFNDPAGNGVEMNFDGAEATMAKAV